MVDSAVGEAGDEAAAVATSTEDRRERKRHPIRRWFKKVFGSGQRNEDEKKDDGNRPPA